MSDPVFSHPFSPLSSIFSKSWKGWLICFLAIFLIKINNAQLLATPLEAREWNENRPILSDYRFRVGNLNFRSTSYQWLVFAGAKAQYKGDRTINGSGDYGFRLTATDGQLNGGGGVDKFRLKIWEKATGEIVYDNQMGAAEDADATDAIEGAASSFTSRRSLLRK